LKTNVNVGKEWWLNELIQSFYASIMKAELPTKGIDNEHSSDATNQNHYNGENC
jgi:hypothetical protein